MASKLEPLDESYNGLIEMYRKENEREAKRKADAEALKGKGLMDSLDEPFYPTANDLAPHYETPSERTFRLCNSPYHSMFLSGAKD